VDLIGYRRWGHNEGDDPSFTQPRVYESIEKLLTVREAFAANLVRRGVVRQGDPEAFLKAGLDEFQRIRDRVRLSSAELEPTSVVEVSHGETRTDGVLAPRAGSTRQGPMAGQIANPGWQTLKSLNEKLLTFPAGFNLHPKLDRALQRRRAAFDGPDGVVDWAHAETLALATLLTEGIPVRLTGQDSIRGTFSQRHLAFYDTRAGKPHMPLSTVSATPFSVYNSPLSESATLGFEYGFSVQSSKTLVLWEAQYGDFINGAQVIVDEFVVSAQAKWGLVSGLVLLLPHAWEGQGPDHSSGRLERFLEQAAEDNIQVANCTTAAQYYFLLRRQAATLGYNPRPLVLMTPKSLLRHRLSASHASDLTTGDFQTVLDDARASAHPHRVSRIVLCSGHIWAEIESDQRRQAADDVAVIRLEQLYPFPGQALIEVLDKYAGARETLWLQEEPLNMGAWWFVERELRDVRSLGYVGRPALPTPAEGWAQAHAAEQQRIISQALEGVAASAS
jgi:2-oxoglutarate dehydrogenase E1 component